MGMNWSRGKTSDFQVHILEACDKRNDEWFSCILARFENVKELRVIDVIYHICNINYKAHR